MRTLVLAAAIAVAGGSLAQAASAAGPAGPDPAKLQKLRDKVRADHKAVVAENLPLSEAEAKAFWPAYDKCHKDMDAAQRQVNQVILDYVNGESKLTDTYAKKLSADLLKAEAEEAKARKSCFDRVAKVLPGKKAARYLQIESKIRALNRFDAAVAIPLVD